MTMPSKADRDDLFHRLGKLETGQEAITARVAIHHDVVVGRLDALHDDVRQVQLMLTGNGAPERGLLVRIDRIETARRLAAWVGGFMLAAIAVLIVARIQACEDMTSGYRFRQQQHEAKP